MGRLKREICRRFRTLIQIFCTHADHIYFFQHRMYHSSWHPSVRFCVSSYLNFASTKFWVRHFHYFFQRVHVIQNFRDRVFLEVLKIGYWTLMFLFYDWDIVDTVIMYLFKRIVIFFVISTTKICKSFEKQRTLKNWTVIQIKTNLAMGGIFWGQKRVNPVKRGRMVARTYVV